MKNEPLARQVRTRVGPGDLLFGFQAAGFTARLREEGYGERDEFGGEGAAAGGDQVGEGLGYGFVHAGMDVDAGGKDWDVGGVFAMSLG